MHDLATSLSALGFQVLGEPGRYYWAHNESPDLGEPDNNFATEAEAWEDARKQLVSAFSK